jgi:hypothetical protein
MKNGSETSTTKNEIWTIIRKNFSVCGNLDSIDTFRFWKENDEWYILEGIGEPMILPKEVVDVIIKQETKNKLRE